MNPEAIPSTLKALDQWVCWRYESHSSRKKPMKAPYSSITGQRASVQESTTWAPFPVAYQRFQENKTYDGIGLVLTRHDDIVGIDIDHCIDESHGVGEAAQSVIKLVDSYTEISPSGQGIRIFAEADLREFAGRRSGDIELYNFGRYLTVTGNHLEGTPRNVQPRLPQLRQLYKQYFSAGRAAPTERRESAAPPLLDQSDEQVLQRMFSGKQGELYRQIYEGNTGSVYSGGMGEDPDESRADVLLFNALAFYTYQDTEQMKRILLASPRGRQRLAKWHKRVRGEKIYLDYQIEDSISHTRKR